MTNGGQTSTVSHFKSLGLVTLAAWGLFAAPAWLLADVSGLIGLSAAVGLCLFPGVLVLLLGRVIGDDRGVFFLVAGGLRTGFVMTGAVLVRTNRPETGFAEFFTWLILLYLICLAAETWLILRDLKQ